MSYFTTTAAFERVLLAHPRLVAGLTRTITAPVLGRALASTWSIYWNELVDGATPSLGRVFATGLHRAGAFLTAPTETGREIAASLAR